MVITLRKAVIALFVLLFSVNIAHGSQYFNTFGSKFSSNIKNVSNDYDYNDENSDNEEVKSATSYPRVTAFENKIFNKSYTNEEIYPRLSRIEKSLFGKIYSDDALSDRVDRISDAIDKKNDSYSRNDDDDDDDDSEKEDSRESLSSSNITTRDVSEMERRLFDKTYDSDDTVTRVERLEANIFGAIQNGDPKSRLNKLKLASQKQYLADFGFWDKDTLDGTNKGPDPYYSSNPYGLIDYLKSYLTPFVNKVFGSGYVTGAGANSYSNNSNGFGSNSYSNSYSNSRPGSYSDEFRDSNMNFGTGVKILED